MTDITCSVASDRLFSIPQMMLTSKIKKAISEFPKRPPAWHAQVFEQWNAVSYGTEFSRDLLRNIKV
ncbi:hypothetical protein KKI24_20900, partial [bacterium]|nr:hypothetical protein [bacterium]